MSRSCVFVRVNRIFAGIAREAIRSVSHPDLALVALMPDQIFEPKEARRIASSWAPSGPVLFGQSLDRPGHSLTQAHSGAPGRRPARRRRAQKTFSAGPRSFNTREPWFSDNLSAVRGQPCSDSRHGRITCKVPSKSTLKLDGKQPPPIKPKSS